MGRNHIVLSISALTLATALAFPAAAQEAPAAVESSDQLSDITVTARRKSESLQSVPLTVTAFSAETIANKGIRNFEDVIKLTPGIFFDKGFVQQDSRPNIRGLPATRGRPPVGVLLDGIDISTESIGTAGGGNLANLQLVDLQRIEVVKGPQSALYGRVAFGGAINYITVEPSTQRVEGYVSGDIGTYGKYQTRGAVNVPLSDDLAVRVNGAYSYFDGFYENAQTGKTIGGSRSAGGAVAVKYQPRDNIKIIARGSYSDDTYEPRAQYYLGGGSGLRETVPLPANVAGQQVGIIGATQTTIGSTAYFARRGELSTGTNVVRLSTDPATGKDFEGTHSKTFIGSLRSEIGLVDNITLSTWTGYTNYKGTQRQDADFYASPLGSVTMAGKTVTAEIPGNATGLFIFDAATQTQQFSQEIRVGDQVSHGFRWTLGGLYWYEDVKQQLGSISNAGFSSGGVPVNVFADLVLLGGRGPAQDQGRTTKHFSVYAQGEVDLTNTLTLSAEGRYAREDYDYLFAKSIAISTVAVNGIYPFTTTGSAYTSGTSTTYFAPRAAINYKPSQNLLIYASAARGIKPAGLSQVQTLNPQDAAFGTEKLNNYEIGFKSTLLDRRLQFNASVFRMDYKDKQESTLVPVPFSVNPQGNVSLIQNVGGARIDGAEVEINALLAPGLTFNIGYTYLNARYTNYDLPSTSPITIALAGGCTIKTVGNLKGCYVNLNGNRLEGSARNSAVASLNYHHPINDHVKVLIETDLQYRSRRYQDNTNAYWYAPYANVDMRVGVETAKYSLIAYVTNLFDNRSIQSAQSSGDTQALPSGGLSLSTYAADKRQIGLRGRVNF
jgi:outer membrane receptor protein involved in Fe transport